MVKLYKDGYSCAEIALLYRLSRVSIWQRLKKAGVVMRNPRKAAV